MEEQSVSDSNFFSNIGSRNYETSPAYLRDVLQSVVEIGSSLRLPTDKATLFQSIVNTTCNILRFRYAALYLSDGAGSFRVAATSGIGVNEKSYLQQHPLPDNVAAQIVDENYRISDSYFLPVEAPIWRESELARYFVAVDSPEESRELILSPPSLQQSDILWRKQDLLVVPLVSADEQLLGFLTPDIPLNGLRPTREIVTILELFANQAAVVIEWERLRDELHEVAHQARASERVKNNFLLAASHELRTPLTAIQGYLELLSEYDHTLDNEERTRFIQNARRGCDELVLLLGNVLDVTQLDVEKINFRPVKVALAQAVQLILEILEPIIDREKHQIEVQIAQDLYVWVDELRLRQILFNLLGNTLKYTPTGSPVLLSVESIGMDELLKRYGDYNPEHQLSEPVSGAFVILIVRDYGPGVPLAEQAQLFTKFTRLESAKNSSQPGAGLGLYLCRQFIQSMGGAIWMESSGVAGEGTTFFVALPEYRE